METAITLRGTLVLCTRGADYNAHLHLIQKSCGLAPLKQ